MDTEEFRQLAERVLGPYWIGGLASATGIDARTIRRIASDKRDIPAALIEALNQAESGLQALHQQFPEPSDRGPEIGGDGQVHDWTLALIGTALLGRGESEAS